MPSITPDVCAVPFVGECWKRCTTSCVEYEAVTAAPTDRGPNSILDRDFQVCARTPDVDENTSVRFGCLYGTCAMEV